MLGQVCSLCVGKSFVIFAFEVGNAGTGHHEGRYQHTDNDDRGQQSRLYM
jgi:hypothetical protein